MRDFKFRTWVKEEEKMYVGKMALGTSRFTNNFAYRKSEVITMQYTDVYDENQNRICECDIVKTWDGKIRHVVWHKSEYRFETHESERGSHRYECFHGACEIIGNSMENPELMNS